VVLRQRNALTVIGAVSLAPTIARVVIDVVRVEAMVNGAAQRVGVPTRRSIGGRAAVASHVAVLVVRKAVVAVASRDGVGVGRRVVDGGEAVLVLGCCGTGWVARVD